MKNNIKMIDEEAFKLHVEDITGGPNGCQIKMGGTCQRPDIFLGNKTFCDGCEYYKFCLCSNKRLLVK